MDIRRDGKKLRIGERVLTFETDLECARAMDVAMAAQSPQSPVSRGPAPDAVVTIGTLDRCLSEMLILAGDPETTEADRQTLKHHADDLEGVAAKVKQLLAAG